MRSPSGMSDEYIAYVQEQKYYGRRRCKLGHETKYYPRCIKLLKQYFRGWFKRLEGHGEWGWPDLFGFDDRGRTQFCEVKMRDRALRPMQREFYLDVASHRRRSELQPGLWVIRIYDDREPIIAAFNRWTEDEEIEYERWNV